MKLNELITSKKDLEMAIEHVCLARDKVMYVAGSTDITFTGNLLTSFAKIHHELVQSCRSIQEEIENT